MSISARLSFLDKDHPYSYEDAQQDLQARRSLLLCLGVIGSSYRPHVIAESEAERNRALAKLNKDLETRIYEARRAESRLADLIMDTKSFRQDEVQELLERRGVLNYQAMTRFILGLLNESGVKIEQSKQMEGVYTVVLMFLRSQSFQFPQ